MVNIDELDRKILRELVDGGYRRPGALGKSLWVSSRTASRRVANLRNRGLIKIAALPNPPLLGYKGWAKIGITVRTGASYDVARELVLHASPYLVAYAVGTFDVVIGVQFREINGLSYFVNNELPKIKGIRSWETMMLSGPRKYYNFRWAPCEYRRQGNEYHGYVASSQNVNEIDDTDRRILGVLTSNGLARPSSMKSMLGLGERTIRRRVKEMSRRDVFRVQVFPDIELLEHEAWATMGITVNDQSADRVLDKMVEIPEIYLASSSVGRFNVIAGARLPNIDALNRLAKLELPSIRGISNVDVFLHNKPLKYHNMNWFHPMTTGTKSQT